MKAYRCVDDKINLFRPDKNMERMRRTAIRAALPVCSFSSSLASLIAYLQGLKIWIYLQLRFSLAIF